MPSPTEIRPPFDEDAARRKVQAAEDAWNSRDPDRVALTYTEDSEWRNRDEFLQGRDEIRAFLRRKWERERDYRLRKTLWVWGPDRIAVRFEYKSQGRDGRWWRSHGNEMGVRRLRPHDPPIRIDQRRPQRRLTDGGDQPEDAR